MPEIFGLGLLWYEKSTLLVWCVAWRPISGEKPSGRANELEVIGLEVAGGK